MQANVPDVQRLANADCIKKNGRNCCVRFVIISFGQRLTNQLFFDNQVVGDAEDTRHASD